MSEEVALVNILQTEDWNKFELETRESIGTKEEDCKFADIRKAARKKDKLMCALTVILLVVFSLAVVVVAMHLKAYYIEKSSGLETQMQQLALNTSGLERKVQTLSNQLGNSESKELFKGEKVSKGKKGDVGARSSKGVDGVKGAVGKKGLNGEKSAVGEKGAIGDMGLTGPAAPPGRKGLTGEKGPLGDKGQNGENGLPGLNGEHGEKGLKGDKGFIGNKGRIGEKGQTGERGQKGEKGSPGETVITPRCGSGWEQLMHGCYYFQFQSKKTWNDAKIDCHNMGGFLVTIDNAFENWFLKSFIKTDKSKGDVWIGAHDFVSEGRFVWEADNASLTFTDWYPGEPNNSANKEDCACMNPTETFRWNDNSCSKKFYYICEKH